MKNSFTEWLIKLSKANNNKNDLMIPHNSIPNPIEKDNESMNEDVCFVSKNKIGIADGAGGVGIFCKDWASYLLNKTPEYSFNSKAEIPIWYNKIREDFYNEIQKKTKEYDDFVIDKFEKEGSFSTLSIVWIVEDELKVFSIGDSGVFCFKKTDENDYKLVALKPYIFYDDINSSPYLLNWNQEITSHYDYFYLKREDVDLIIIASDSISRFIIQCIYGINKNDLSGFINEKFISTISELNNEKFNYTSYNALIDKIMQLSNLDDSNFKKAMIQMVEDDVLEPDDFSLIFHTL